MTIMHRPADARGHRRLDWLDSRHSFSYAHYLHAAHMNFRSLRVINDDTLAAGASFPPQGHREMEVITYVVSGTLAYGDDSCMAGILQRGDVRVLSAGAGLRERQFNASTVAPVRLLQIWVLPKDEDAAPNCQRIQIPESEKRDRLRLLASGDAQAGSLPLRQDVRVYASKLSAGAALRHALLPGRGAWIQIVNGRLDVNGTTLSAGDGLAIQHTDEILLHGITESEFLLIDLA
jgi:redox-sensitive bicupin YhaK (pirin superfamily)